VTPIDRYAIPILRRLYLNQKTNAKLRRKHRKKTDTMREAIGVLAEVWKFFTAPM